MMTADLHNPTEVKAIAYQTGDTESFATVKIDDGGRNTIGLFFDNPAAMVAFAERLLAAATDPERR
jgi:hypothetical protein